MIEKFRFGGLELLQILAILTLILLSNLVLHSISPSIYPQYYIYIFIALISFYIFSRIDIDLYQIFSGHLYLLCLIFLIIPLVIGQVTRGSIRWIPIGSITIQPSEIVKPFLLLFYANFLIKNKINLVNIVKLFIFFVIPFVLILIQPSLGVAVLMSVGFIGIILASSIQKKYILFAGVIILFSLPLIWFLLEPYQKVRISSFLNPSSDPLGTGYNSIQSVISIGSGGLFGRGLGKGVQTQLAFLPEKQSDFIFAAISEELGLLGALLVLVSLLIIFLSLINQIENAKNQFARAYISGVFLILFIQTFIHIGMNMGLVPITGVPLPFVSAGGSALLGTTISLAIAFKARKIY